MVVYKHLDQKAAFSISQRKSKIEMLHLCKKWLTSKFLISFGMNQGSQSGSLKAKRSVGETKKRKIIIDSKYSWGPL